MQPGTRSHPYRRRLRADSGFFLELQFCNEHGLPHSTLLHWDPVDKAKMLAFVVEKGERCVMCGTAQWEWEDNRFAYEPVEKRCPGCYAKDVVAQDSGRNPGVTIELLPTTGLQAAKRQVRAARLHAAKPAKAART